MKKYYTPEIEDFHVGFEYQSEEDPYNSIWENQKIETYRDLANAMEYYGNDADVDVRVKHLDREDIESLGFEEDLGQEHYSIEFEENEIRMESLHPDGLYRIEIKEPRQLMFFTIKNKSELKKILKQIGIQNFGII